MMAELFIRTEFSHGLRNNMTIRNEYDVLGLVMDCATNPYSFIFDTDLTVPRCTKRVYPSKQDANSTIMIRMSYNHKDNVKLRSYYCDECNGWHITHTAERNRK
jgi:hypothetical protein